MLATTVDLRPRNDTGSPNNPPVSTTPPLVYTVEGCSSTLQLLVADSDRDEVRCREVETSECGRGGCVPLPSWVTVESSCTVSFTAAPRGEYYVSLVVEDFPVGSNVPLASVPLSFTVSTLTIHQCDSVQMCDSDVVRFIKNLGHYQVMDGLLLLQESIILQYIIFLSIICVVSLL